MTIDERIAAELRRHTPEVDEAVAWNRIQAAAAARTRARVTRLVPISTAALVVVIVGFILVPRFDSGRAPKRDAQTPFVDTWVTADLDGSTPTMVIRASGNEAVEIVVRDDFASVCSGAPSTMTGTGRPGGSWELVVPSPVLTCDDGSEPQALNGPPLHEQLQNLAFVHDPGRDTLTDNFGSVWAREGAVDLHPEPAAMDSWPQSSLEEVREAQRLAEAGDPDYTWQLEPGLEETLMYSPPYLDIPEILARYLREELDWKEFSMLPGPGFGDGTIIITFVRCAPGQANTMYPDDPRGGRCAPTIDQFRYETVAVTVAQPGVRGPSGIWVVTERERIEPVEQIVPLTDAEAAAILDAFLQARIDGEGAEQHFRGGGHRLTQLLYATSADARYERSEFEAVSGAEWPDGGMRFEVRLFGEDGHTVVEQSFTFERDGADNWKLDPGPETLENGRLLPAPFDIHAILGGQVTFQSAFPWDGSVFGHSFESNGESANQSLYLHPDGQVEVLADPRLPGAQCQEGPAPANAEALAESILSDGGLETTTPSAVTIGGAPALQLDVVTTAGASICDDWPRAAVTRNTLEPDERMRLYLVDLPEGISARVLAVSIIAPESRFDSVVEAAAPILGSFEFYTP